MGRQRETVPREACRTTFDSETGRDELAAGRAPPHALGDVVEVQERRQASRAAARHHQLAGLVQAVREGVVERGVQVAEACHRN